jgi:hypothetical protein
MTRWDEQEFTANDLLLDRQIFDSRGMPAGRVDDLELSDPDHDDPDLGQPPVLTALLCGPTAYGPRIGGRLGTWWLAIGRRLRPVTDPYPNRIPLNLVDHVDRLEIALLTAREELDSYRFRRWVEDKIIGRIPGHTR